MVEVGGVAELSGGKPAGFDSPHLKCMDAFAPLGTASIPKQTWMSVSESKMEVGGVEPPSANPIPARLHV